MEAYNPPRDLWLHILYQDLHIMVVNKPSGLLSVPGRAPENKDSIMTRIQADFPTAESVHRLDMATSGVMVVALTKAAERELKRQFREREPKKSYIARVWGHLEQDEGLIDLPLICDWPNRPKQKVCYETGKSAQTEYQVLCRDADGSTRVKLSPSQVAHTNYACICWPWVTLSSATVSTPIQKPKRWHHACSYMLRSYA